MVNTPTNNKQPEDIFAEGGLKNSVPAGLSRQNRRVVRPTTPSVAPLPPSQSSPPRPVLSQKRGLYIVLVILVIVVAGGVFAVRGEFFSREKDATTNATSNSNSTPTNITNQKVSVPTVSTNAAPDADGDGLTDAEEKSIGTDQNNKDSDADGLFDREEVRVYKTNPLKKDADGDGVNDGDEVKNGTNPNGSGQLLDLNAARQQTSNTNQ